MTPDRPADGSTGNPDDREGGLVLILVALMMSILLLLMSLILSGGEARRDKVLDGGVADSAVLTGAALIDPPPAAPSAGAACLAIIDYLEQRLKNPPVLTGPEATAVCAPFTGVCEEGPLPPATPSFTVPYTKGDTTVQITYPVEDGHSLLGSQPVVSSDGTRCERIGIRIHRDRTSTIVTRDLDLVVNAVARVEFPPTFGDPVSVTLIR